MSQQEMKKAAGEAALEFIKSGDIVGVGTGSTVNCFIDSLATIKHKIEGTVSSSEASTEKLKFHGIPVYNLNDVSEISVYVDGADEITKHMAMIKGGGGALTREKIIAAVAKSFVCIIDDTKLVDVLGKFPLPIEVIPMARSYVARQIIKLGGQPVYREGFVTDNGNQILDVHNMSIIDPPKLEAELNGIVGVVTNGLFAHRGANVIVKGTPNGVEITK